MRYRTFGRTGWQISAVSLGGAYLMGTDPERARERTRALVQRALALGINYIDTAPLYGRSEELLGAALEGEKRPFYLATKVGFDPQDFDYRRDSVLWSLERSLQRLGLAQLAVAQIHEVNLAGWKRIMAPGGTLEGLRAAQERGLCARIGITGRAIPLLARLASTGEFDTVLVYHDYHPCAQLAAQEVIPAAHRQNMGIVVATPLAGGLYVGGPAQARALAAIEDTTERTKAQQVLDQLRPLPGTLPQKAFRYILGDNRVSTVSSGAATVAELEEVAQAADMDPLDHSLFLV
ncbi:MAG: aldo/keto reductase [Candidatus Latescibacteria bacterium]|nr:aldo/keto reductase [Candidatus Latescibacterota bacterium]